MVLFRHGHGGSFIHLRWLRPNIRSSHVARFVRGSTRAPYPRRACTRLGSIVCRSTVADSTGLIFCSSCAGVRWLAAGSRGRRHDDPGRTLRHYSRRPSRFVPGRDLFTGWRSNVRRSISGSCGGRSCRSPRSGGPSPLDAVGNAFGGLARLVSIPPLVPKPELWFGVVLPMAWVVIAIIRDRFARGAVHPVLLFAGTGLILEQGFELLAFDTPAWRATAGALYALLRP